MEVKKSPKANLENKKMFYRELGLILALGVILCAFEWSTSEKTESVIQQEEAAPVEVEQVPVTTEAPPPPVDTDLFISLEDEADLGVEIMDYVAEVAEEVIEEAPIPYTLVEEKPSFNGGDANEFTKWVFQNMVYPDVARENGISGRVTLQFTIETDGSLTNIRVLRGVDPSLDQEAIRVVSMSPKWTPGKQRDKAVRVTYNFPIYFQLRN